MTRGFRVVERAFHVWSSLHNIVLKNFNFLTVRIK